jgi:ABC-type sulfate transport system permease subunit
MHGISKSLMAQEFPGRLKMDNISQNHFNFFQLTENGFLVINILMAISIIFGIIIALLIFRNNLSGKKIMFLGGELIILGLIFNIIIDYKVRYPSLSFITILLGIVISIIGLCRKN